MTCREQNDALSTQLFACRVGELPPGEPFLEARAYSQVEDASCQGFSCGGYAELCPNGTASFVATDISLPGRYGVRDQLLTLLLAETGGETSARHELVVEADGEQLRRLSDGAVFARIADAEVFCP